MEVIDAGLDALADRSLLALRTAAGDQPLALFVDRTLGPVDALHDEWPATLRAAEASSAVQWVPLGRIHDDFASENLPGFFYVISEARAERLVALAMRIAVHEALQDQGQEPRSRCLAGWVLHAPEAPALKTSLTRLARVFKPDGAAWYLRFWDPRVTWHLPRVLTPEQWALARQAMGRWWAMSPLAHFAPLASANGAAASAHAPVEQPLLRFDAAQWARLERVAPINTVLRMAAGWDVLPTEGNARQVDALIERCRQRGFDTEQDALVYAACGLTSHPHFDAHPEVDRALQDAASKGQSIEAAISRFDDGFWHGLATQPWPGNSHHSRDTRTP
jgi:hypothetical protein